MLNPFKLPMPCPVASSVWGAAFAMRCIGPWEIPRSYTMSSVVDEPIRRAAGWK